MSHCSSADESCVMSVCEHVVELGRIAFETVSVSGHGDLVNPRWVRWWRCEGYVLIRSLLGVS